MKKNKKISLLPYVREDIYGLSPEDPQTLGWEIKEFNIEKEWLLSKGEGIKIAVIDTGCSLNHPDIKDNLLEGINIINPKKDPDDDNGHGTHVAGTIAGIDNSYGVVGIAPRSKIIPIKVLSKDGVGSMNNIIKGVIWAANIGVDFICMSLGSPVHDTELEKSINYASSKGVIIFCAAGNSGADSDIMYPARYDNTICIGAIDKNLKRTNFTCSGESLDFLAPGHDIVSCVPNNGYASMSGTSMSAPFAVGCAALLLSFARKNSTPKLYKQSDYISEFKKYARHVEQKNLIGIRKYEGYGVLSSNLHSYT